MAEKAIIPVASSLGLLPSSLSGLGGRPLTDFSQVNPVKPIDIPEDEVPGYEEEKEAPQSHPETKTQQTKPDPIQIPFSEEDMDVGSDEELLPPDIISEVQSGFSQEEQKEFFEVVQERVQEANRIVNEVNQDLPRDAQENESFQKYLTKLVLKGVFGQLTIGSIAKFVVEIYREWVKQGGGSGGKDGIDSQPPPTDSFERTVYWSQHVVPPHCKRHIYTDKDGNLNSILVCSDEHGTRTYHNR